jgi:hypothetical protein
MRTTFLVGSRTLGRSRYLLMNRDGRHPVPFPGPWTVKAVVRNEPLHPDSASSLEMSERRSSVRSAAPDSSASTAR